MKTMLIGFLTMSTALMACGDNGGNATDIDAATGTPDATVGVPDAQVCNTSAYPVDYHPTEPEVTAQAMAIADFETATGTRVGLSEDGLAAVVGFDGGAIPITLDAGIVDNCARAEAGLRTFIAANAAMLHMPDDMTVRACSYDSVTDSEIVRLTGGTYGNGRGLVAVPNDLVMHIKRNGTLRFWSGSYLPNRERAQAMSCFAKSELEQAMIGEDLTYQRFSACVLGDGGAIEITSEDSRVAGEPAAYLDATGSLHAVRVIEVLLDASNVTNTEINSDLYCCAEATLNGCVGNFVVVDELTGDLLQQIPRCQTC